MGEISTSLGQERSIQPDRVAAQVRRDQEIVLGRFDCGRAGCSNKPYIEPSTTGIASSDGGPPVAQLGVASEQLA